ncbi:hypothetical protein, partial [Segetibacter sp. 3557_3]|uniref:hypothetical protein n=1 Tax=Segetibacter sp. 3557_3 TaxID=2547429 RepID=UPI0014043A29
LAECVAQVPRLLIGQPISTFLEDQKISVNAHFCTEIIPALTFVYDLVHGVYSADLIDICVRDLHTAGRTWIMPEGLINAGAILIADAGTPAFPTTDSAVSPRVYRYGVNCKVAGSVDTSILSDLSYVHRTRRDIAATGFYAERKCIADAMLDKALRLLEQLSPTELERPCFSRRELLKIGDDEFLDLLEQAIDSHNFASHDNIIRKIRIGQLFSTFFVVDAVQDATTLRSAWTHIGTAQGRSSVEAAIAKDLALDASDIIVSLLPEEMQGKVPTTLVSLKTDDWRPLNTLSQDTCLITDMMTLNESYADLRKMFFLVNPHSQFDRSVGIEVCRQHLSRMADSGGLQYAR